MVRALTTPAVLAGALLLGAYGAAGVSSNAAAAPQFSFARAPAAAAAASPYDIVRLRLAGLTAFLGAQPEREPAAIRAFLEREVAPQFDFAAMSQWAAGPFYAGLTPEQKTALAEKVRAMFLDSLARNLGAYAANVPDIRVYPSRSPAWARQEIVRARVTPAETYPIILDFRFYLGPEGWRIFDVAANGFSAVTYYRRLFADRVRVAGPQALYQ